MYSQANRVAVCYKGAGKKSRTTLQSMIPLLSLNTHLSLVFTLLGFCGFKRFWFLFVCLFFFVLLDILREGLTVWQPWLD